jgi:hypothetical protein
MNGLSMYPHVSNFLSTTELPLPTLDECKETNPVYHLPQLDEFMKLKGIPGDLQLPVAYRSTVGSMSKQWVETVSTDIKNYQEFRQAFLSTFWLSNRQSLVRCNLYQGKYNRNAGLSLSGHFLKYATMASYLDPKPTDGEIVQAIISHYSITIQRVMLSSQIKTIGKTLDLLKRIAAMELNEGSQRPLHQNQAQQPHHVVRQNQQNSGEDRRPQHQNQVRQVDMSIIGVEITAIEPKSETPG